MLIITKEAKRAMESRVFRRVLLGSDFPGGTLGFLGHLISPTVSEANVEGRPTINRANLSIINNRLSITIIIELGPWQYYRATTEPL
jgi:hypothetical protein